MHLLLLASLAWSCPGLQSPPGFQDPQPVPEKLVGGGWAATRLFEVALPTVSYRFGYGVRSVDDLDGDGAEDVAALVYPGAGSAPPGTMLAFSSSTGTMLWSVANPGPPWIGFDTEIWPVGDLDADGVGDLAMGDYGSFYGSSGNWVTCISGATGRILHLIPRPSWINFVSTFGRGICDAGDIDFDGHDDLLVSVPTYSPTPTFHPEGVLLIFSGKDGSFLRQIDGPVGTLDVSRFGWTVATFPDLDGDTLPEYLVTAPFSDSGSLWFAGAIFLISSATGSPLYQVAGSFVNEHLGMGPLLVLEDIDGDGIADFTLGRDSQLFRFPYDLVRTYSGANGALLWGRTQSPLFCVFGARLASVEDYSRDGHRDLAVGAPSFLPWMPGRVYILDGQSGEILRHMESPFSESFFGWYLSSLSTSAAFPLGAVLVGNPELITPDGHSGAVLLMEFEPYLRRSPNSITASSGGTLTVDLDFPVSAAQLPARLLFSATGRGPTAIDRLLVPLTVDTLFLRTAALAALDLGPLDAQGDLTGTISVPPGRLAPLVGRTLWMAAVCGSVRPVLSSVALPWVVAP